MIDIRKASSNLSSPFWRDHSEFMDTRQRYSHSQRPGFLVAASRFASWSVKLGLQALGIFLVIFPGVGSILAIAGGGEVAVGRGAARPRRRIPQLCPHEGFGTVIEGFFDSDD